MNNSEAQGQEILRERARLLAAPPPRGVESGSMMEVLEFRLAQEHYAVENYFVQEVQPLKDLTPLPCTPPFIRGIVNIRGHIFPVVDLKKFFELPEAGLTDLHRIILVQGRDLEMGLLVDQIDRVRSLPVERLQPALPTLTAIGSHYLKGITAERLIVLNLERILHDPKIIVHEEVET